MYAAARLAGRTGAEDGNRWGSRWKPEQKTATTASAIERATPRAAWRVEAHINSGHEDKQERLLLGLLRSLRAVKTTLPVHTMIFDGTLQKPKACCAFAGSGHAGCRLHLTPFGLRLGP